MQIIYSQEKRSLLIIYSDGNAVGFIGDIAIRKALEIKLIN